MITRVIAIAMLVSALGVGASSAEPRGHSGGSWRGGGHHQGGWGGHSGHRGGGGYNYRRHGYDPGTAFWGGVFGGLAGSLFGQREPDVVVVPQPPVEELRTEEWCAQRYRSYDIETHTYTGYDGVVRGCP
jgi:hypothetical protein